MLQFVDLNQETPVKRSTIKRKKDFNEILKVGDIIYVKQISENNFSLKQIPKINGGIVVMDPYTGRVMAISGGFSFKNSEFNRASQALRQPGSAFKPFVYALALENNFTPSSLVLDAPLVLDQGSDLKMWKPENYGKKFYGPSTLRVGLEKSRNLMTVRIAQKIGIKNLVSVYSNILILNNTACSFYIFSKDFYDSEDFGKGGSSPPKSSES